MPRIPILLLVMFLVGCRRETGNRRTPSPAPHAAVHPGNTGPLHDLGDGLLCGGQPRGEAGFQELARLGVRTVVSVDGMAPNVETARRLGLRYVHIPVGYDGIPEPERLRLVRAVKESPGPVFIHCHHGRHRGPAAAAAVARALRGWDADRATRWMREAGTDPRYTGLFRDAAGSRPVPAEILARDRSPLPERTETSPLVRTMVAVDHESDALKARRGGGFPGGASDRVSSAAALRIAELFAEAARDASRGTPGLRQDLEAASAVARSLSDLLEAGATAPVVEERFRQVSSGCTECHRRHRDARLHP